MTLDPGGWKTKVLRKLRYADVGDWDDLKREVRVLDARQLPSAKLGGLDPALVHAAVLTHEWIEMLLSKHQGFHGWQVDRFEVSGRGVTAPGLNLAHRFALRIERELIEKFGYDWKMYNRVLDSLYRLSKTRHRGRETKGSENKWRRTWPDARAV